METLSRTLGNLPRNTVQDNFHSAIALQRDFDNSYGHPREYAAGIDLVHERQRDPAAYFLSAGWACSYKMLSCGGRQIISFHIPGDFLGLNNILFHRAVYNIYPITTVHAVKLNSEQIFDTFTESSQTHPKPLRAIFRDEAMMIERLASLGRRNATERTAQLLLELWGRLRQVGLARPNGFDCPLSQYHLADALGLSAVHVNRVLRELRDDGLLTFRKAVARFDDFDRLVRLADFNANYLEMDF